MLKQAEIVIYHATILKQIICYTRTESTNFSIVKKEYQDVTTFNMIDELFLLHKFFLYINDHNAICFMIYMPNVTIMF